jgi:hypothetical protein
LELNPQDSPIPLEPNHLELNLFASLESFGAQSLLKLNPQQSPILVVAQSIWKPNL